MENDQWKIVSFLIPNYIYEKHGSFGANDDRNFKNG